MAKPQATTQTITLDDGRIITLETGRFARQADGAVMVSIGNTMMLATVVGNKKPKEGADFFPLTVDYVEKYSSTGRFPGGFFKRETRLSDYEVLISRLVDRAIRPLFPDGYNHEVQILVWLLSSDRTIAPDCLVGLAASAALSISGLPFEGPISEVRVAKIDGKYVINPNLDDIPNATLDIMVSGSQHDINMVEGEMKEVGEHEMLEAIKVAHEAIKKHCLAQIEFREKIGKPLREFVGEEIDTELETKISDLFSKGIYEVAKGALDKDTRSEKLSEIIDTYIEALPEETEDAEKAKIKKYYSKLKKKVIRDMVLNEGIRLDGRKTDQIRDIWCETNVLPMVHGSALFTRGETQALASVTLGTKLDEQLIDGAIFKGYNKFLLHYNFPGFSTGEVKPNRAPARREVGHGNLALRALKPVLPGDDVSPYTIRITADILESNGSSSMATVCSGTLALMDAGVKLLKPVSGIAMGLISGENGKVAILSDILGDEDHLGDMDFKVTGTADGITACQMDLKVDGLPYEVLERALNQAKAGRLHILGIMNAAMPQAREDFKPFVPRMERFAIDKDFIGAVIGTGGKVIQQIQKETGAVITIDEVDGKGMVEVSSANKESLQAAVDWIMGIVTVPEPGTNYTGTVKNIMDFGAFVEFLPGKEGLLHISEISWDRVNDVHDVLKEGDKVDVQLVEVDQRTGKFRLSRRPLLPRPEGMEDATFTRPQSDRGGDRRGGGRDDRRGGGGDRGGRGGGGGYNRR